MASVIDKASARFNELRALEDKAGTLEERKQLMNLLKVSQQIYKEYHRLI